MNKSKPERANRENAFFKSSSRIYNQAIEATHNILSEITKNKEWQSAGYNILKDNNLLSPSTIEEKERALLILQQHTATIAKAIDTRIAIPTLIQSTEEYYYGNNTYKTDAPWLGTAIKLSIAEIWNNSAAETTKSASISKLKKIIYLSAAQQQLEHEISISFALKCNPIEIRKNGIFDPAPERSDIVDSWNKMTILRGAGQRTVHQSLDIVWKSPIDFLYSVHLVLSGKSPKSIELFKDSIFSEVGNNKDFWLPIALRLILLISIKDIKEAVSDKYYGLVLFEEFPIYADNYEIPKNISPDDIQRETFKLFWRHDWKSTQRNSLKSNLLVERPAIRVDNKTFATSMLNIVDSTNSFIEASIFGNIEITGAKVDESAFQKFISQPFEDRICKKIINIGWQASQVKSNGYWKSKGIILESYNNLTMPGEIDVLAVHPSNKFCLIIECKILDAPYSKEKLRNIKRKLGPEDSEQFHSKLYRKINWLKTVPYFFGTVILGVIIVDRGAFLSDGSQNRVLDEDDLIPMLEGADKIISDA
ncbi:hypothetical protein [Pseudomonas nitroreducens]|uniref:hypothetical protein n=1 Tax=Pseudomonas nitroreducens TaxID=46680 RepID=UPI002D7E8AC7|nr:hypothetical protein [Pseudomonas nitroreducens]